MARLGSLSGFPILAAFAMPLALAAPAEAPGPKGAPVEVQVAYLTNRSLDGKGTDPVPYGGDRGTPRQGSCQVDLAPIPLIGDLAANVPFYLPSETQRVRATEEPDRALFWDRLVESAGRTETGSVVLFVHGYSNAFERSCRMAAQLQRALQGKATVLLFSWPSLGQALEYARDQAALEWSVPLLAETIGTLSRRIGPGRTQILAHSLGSRGVIFGLEWLGPEVTRPAVARLVFLAPDFDAQTFPAHLPRLAALAPSITVYASDNDAPLKVSERLHRAPRLGQGGALRTLVPGVETIDVSNAGRWEVLGHEYFYRHPKVLADLVTLLVGGQGADRRPGLERKAQGGLMYWDLIGRGYAEGSSTPQPSGAVTP